MILRRFNKQRDSDVAKAANRIYVAVQFNLNVEVWNRLHVDV